MLYLFNFLVTNTIFHFRSGQAKGKSDKSWKKSTASLPSPSSSKNFDIQIANWRLESIVRESDSGSDDEFFDCQGMRSQICLEFVTLELRSMAHIGEIES